MTSIFSFFLREKKKIWGETNIKLPQKLQVVASALRQNVDTKISLSLFIAGGCRVKAYLLPGASKVIISSL